MDYNCSGSWNGRIKEVETLLFQGEVRRCERKCFMASEMMEMAIRKVNQLRDQEWSKAFKDAGCVEVPDEPGQVKAAVVSMVGRAMDVELVANAKAAKELVRSIYKFLGYQGIKMSWPPNEENVEKSLGELVKAVKARTKALCDAMMTTRLQKAYGFVIGKYDSVSKDDDEAGD